MAKNKEKFNSQIKVIGFGGSGCNTINRLASFDFGDIELIAANTDFRSLQNCKADVKIFLGENSCKGLGAGGNMRLGKIAAEESFREIVSSIQDANLIFLTTGMGGGTGTGAIEIAARVASSLEIPSISFVTLPFSFESDNRITNANEGTMNLQPFTNTLVTIPNDKILGLSDRETPIGEALGMADTVLINSILGINDLIRNSGVMNIDISYVLKELEKNDGIFISRGSGIGENKIIEAIKDAQRNPLISVEPIQNASGIIIKFNGNLSIREVDTAIAYLQENTKNTIEITPIIENSLDQDTHVLVSIMLTGLGATPFPLSFPAKRKPVIQKYSQTAQVQDQKAGLNSSEREYEDILEVPAFLRKGYNPK